MSPSLTKGKSIDQAMAHNALLKRTDIRSKIVNILKPTLELLGDPTLKEFVLNESNGYVFDASSVMRILTETKAAYLTIVLGAHDAASRGSEEGFKEGDQTVMLVPCNEDPTGGNLPVILKALTFTDEENRGTNMVALEHPPTTAVSEIRSTGLYFKFINI